MNEVFFRELGIREPDYYLNVASENLGKTMGNIISSSYEVMQKCNPEALLVLGDTNSCLSVISAKRLKIPIFHLEAETDFLMKICLKRLIGELLTIQVMSIYVIPNMREDI